MNNKGSIRFLTVLLTAICLFYLSFSWKKMQLEDKVSTYVESQYADSIAANGELYSTTAAKSTLKKTLRRRKQSEFYETESFMGFNYQKINQFALNLGLDLQGGMHATLKVSPVEIIKSKASLTKVNSPEFLAAIEAADQRKLTEPTTPYTELFLDAWVEKNGEGTLSQCFLKQGEAGPKQIGIDDSDQQVIEKLQKEIDESLNAAVEILRNRVDQFGTTQPIISPDFNAGRIEVQIPGADDEKSIRRKLNAVAELEFCEVWENSGPDAQVVNDMILKIGEFLEARTPAATPATEDADTTTDEGDTQPESADEGMDELFGDEEPEVTPTEITAAGDSTKEDSSATAEDELFGGDLAEEADSADAPAQSTNPLANYFTFSRNSGNFYAINIDSVKSLFSRPAIRKLMPPNMTLCWDRGRDIEGNIDPETSKIFYFVKKGPGFPAALCSETIGDRKIVESAYQDFDHESGQAIINMGMTPAASAEWSAITKRNINRRIAILLDDKVYSAPVVRSQIDGSSQISGRFKVKEAQDLANILEAGSLPTPTEIVRMVFIGPSLGKEAISKGLFSLIAGLSLVVIFMIAYYNKAGLVANLALAFNIIFILGVLSVPSLSATLTLPGIAGIVLTVGMAIDANVLIFERIREELRNGKNMQNAVNVGYQKALWTIIDSNVTTLITAILLATAGTGLVKGFGVTLIIGICCSFFSSVYITRLFIDGMVKNKDKIRISFATPLSKKLFQNNNFKIIGNRKKAYLLSLVIIVTGVSIIFTKGLNLGVEFSGGRAYVVKFNKEVNVTDVKDKLKPTFGKSAMNVKTFDGADRVRITTNFLSDSLAKTDILDSIVYSKLNGALDANFSDLDPDIEEVQTSAASISAEIKEKAIWSMVLALGAIFIYILIRFNRWQFSVGAIAALFHDVLFVLSMFAIVGLMGVTYELDEVFVAAILTIIGYSINDTVVVFDRVREFLRANPKSGMAETLNNSINSTMSRTLMTSFTTLLVVLILFIFGGSALAGFSFALLVGILVGTYSSIFIATPIVLDTTGDKSIKGLGEKRVIEDTP